MSKEFENFVRSTANRVGSQATIDAARETKTWQDKLEELYRTVEQSLSPFIKDGTIAFSTETVQLQEELLGRYEAKAARIVLGNRTARLKPIATFIIGARGRVDLVGPRGIVRIVLVPANATGYATRKGASEKNAQPDPPVKDWSWKFTTPPPRITYVDVDQDSFQNALMEVMGAAHGE